MVPQLGRSGAPFHFGAQMRAYPLPTSIANMVPYEVIQRCKRCGELVRDVELCTDDDEAAQCVPPRPVYERARSRNAR